jgi:hypothetical protein
MSDQAISEAIGNKTLDLGDSSCTFAEIVAAL